MVTFDFERGNAIITLSDKQPVLRLDMLKRAILQILQALGESEKKDILVSIAEIAEFLEDLEFDIGELEPILRDYETYQKFIKTKK